MSQHMLQPNQLTVSQGLTAFEAINANTQATLLDSILLDDKPIFALWESENIRVIEPKLEEICLTFHITGSIRVRNNVIGNHNVKFNSIALYGLNNYEWNIYNKIRYAHLYFWKDLLNFDPEAIAPLLQHNPLHGIKDQWVEGLFKMITSYENSQERKEFILKMYQDCFNYVHQKYLSKKQDKPQETGGCTSFQVGKLQQFIENHYASKMNIDDFCETLNWSRSHLFREFKKTFGTTPYKFLLQKRFSIAQNAIASGLPLEEVCQLSGIENLSQLNYLFQKNLGISPKAYAQLPHLY